MCVLAKTKENVAAAAAAVATTITTTTTTLLPQIPFLLFILIRMQIFVSIKSAGKSTTIKCAKKQNEIK